MKKDLFNGVLYDVIEPREGNIVRINLHNRNYMVANGIRDYLLVIYPNKDNVYGKQLNCLCYIGYLGAHGEGEINCFADKIVYVKPTIHDILEFSQMLRENGVIYDKSKKELIKIEK